MSSKRLTTEQRRANAMASADITDDERERIAALVQAHGLRRAAEMLELDKGTLQRMLPPLPVKKQTAHWVRAKLEIIA